MADSSTHPRWLGLLAVPVAVVLLSAGLVGLAASPGAADDFGHARAGSLLVTVEDPAMLGSVVDRGLTRLRDAGHATASLSALPLTDRVARLRVAAGGERDAARTLAGLDGVVAVEPDSTLGLHREPNDPAFADQWAHGAIETPAAWETTTGSERVVVAVIDTGMRGDHPDLEANIAGQVDVSTGAPAGRVRVGVDNDTCDLGHGTWVGGVIGGVGDNGADVAGVNWQVDLLDIATYSTRSGASCDGTSLSAVIAGIDYAVNDLIEPADVINISLGSYLEECPAALQAAVDEADEAGAVVVASAGNGQQQASTAGAIAYPAGCDDVVAVGATGRDDRRAGYSQVNPSVDLVAPGGDYETGGLDGLIVTTNHSFDTSRLAYVQGTSFAAPYVAGVAALTRDLQPLSGPGEVRRILTDTAHDLGPAGPDDAYGHGLVQADAAVAAAIGALPEPTAPDNPLSPSPSPSPTPTGEAQPPDTDASVARLEAGRPSRAVSTAVAVSREVFAEAAAEHAVLARSDLFADALAGSTLAYGAGPLLFTPSTGPLAAPTRAELQRVLPEGGVVYLLGGSQALPTSLEDQLRDLGYQPRRLAGNSREQTAVAVADEARRRVPRLGGTNPTQVVLATRGNWPDAVTAGALGATFGMPVLITPTGSLDPATRAFLDRVGPRTIYVAGGTAAVSEATATAAADVADARTIRLAGATRLGTAVEIAREYDRLHGAATGDLPQFAIAVNMFRDDAWAHILAASALAGKSTGVFVPTNGLQGTQLASEATSYLRSRYDDHERVLGAAIGATDLISDTAVQQLQDRLNGR